ncbi:MAG: MBL fold metallo-hydrolase [Chloroflexota bacterium]
MNEGSGLVSIEGHESVFGLEVPCGDGVDVRALLVCGETYTVLVDTLLSPPHLGGAASAIASRGKPLLVVNSHADWDHWWGNAAFPDAPVIAHRLTQERQRTEGKRSLIDMQRKDSQTFSGITLKPATIAFEGALSLDIGGLHIELSLLPGHTRDCIVAYIPERRLLFAGDVAEDPIPLLNAGGVGSWADMLEEWATRADTVVPAHGAIAGPELLRRNATYLHGLTDDPSRKVTELEGALPFYRRAHTRNLKRAIAVETC